MTPDAQLDGSSKAQLSGFALKIIAITSMLIDHLGKIVPGSVPIMAMPLGRIAWPIFAYFIAEGMRRTRNPTKYFLRLGYFAFLSEFAFDLTLGGGHLDFQHHTNVFFTLFFGALAIYCFSQLKSRLPFPRVVNTLIAFIPAAVLATLAELLESDYRWRGVVFILLLYLIPSKMWQLVFMSVYSLIFFAPWIGSGWSPYTILMTICLLIPVGLIALYRGRQGHRMKWLFYLFYPVHLFALFFIANFVANRTVF